MLTKDHSYVPYLMWSFPMMFFAFQFILRLWPGLMMQQIMEQFSIDATHFGMVAAFYYYGYALMQIPVAILLDRYPTRYTIFSFAILCGLATLVFTYSTHWYLACLSRFMVGAGSAVGFLGVSKVVSEWFPKQQYSKMIGFSFTLGLMGAIYGGKPISLLIEAYSWKYIALTLAIISMLIGFLSYICLRSKYKQDEPVLDKDKFHLSHFKTLLCSPTLWLLAIANLLMVGSLEGFSDVWGVPYLMTAYGLSKSNAAQLISFIFLGMLFGGPLLAFLSKKIGNYTIIAFCGLWMVCAFVFLLFSSDYNGWLFASLFFTVGIMCCYQVIVFAAGSDLVKPQLLGVTIAFLNCINMLGGSFFHTVIGKVMDIYWTGAYSADGVKRYSVAAYQAGLLFIPICALVGTLIILFIRLTLSNKNQTMTH